MKFKYRILPHLLLIICLTAIIGCTNSQDKKRTIAVSIQPQRFLLEKIVGDKFDVICLLSQGSNPEAYEPNMTHLMNLEKSEAFFKIGNIGFELAIANKLMNNNLNIKVYNNSEGIPLIHGSHETIESDGHVHEVDPHIWSSVVNCKVIAKNMYNALIELDPKHHKYYTKNFENLNKELDALNDSIAKKLAPLKGSSFLIWHPSLSYFARDYGLKQISLEHNGKESSIRNFKHKIDEAKADSAKVFFHQVEMDSRQAETANNEIKAKMVTINPMNYHWFDEMLNTANALANR